MVPDFLTWVSTELKRMKQLGMDVWQSTKVVINDASLGNETSKPCLSVTATPGKHVAGVIGAINDAILHAIPPVSDCISAGCSWVANAPCLARQMVT